MTVDEKKIFDAIYSCGTITRSLILKNGVSDAVIHDLIDLRMIKKQALEIKDKKIAIYVFTKLGEKYYTEQTNKVLFFRCPSIKKSTALAYIYSSLPTDVKQTWKNKDEWMYEEEDSTVPDATFIINDKLNGISILNSHNKEAIKNKKTQLAQFKIKHNLNKFYIKYY